MVCCSEGAHASGSTETTAASTYVQLKGLLRCPVASGNRRQEAEHLPDHMVQVAQLAQLLQAHIWDRGPGRWTRGSAPLPLHTGR